MRILVIGGNGFIGSPLLRELRKSGHDVAVFHRHAFSPSGDVRQILGDRNQLMEHRAEIAQFAPQVVIDLILSSGGQARELMHSVRGIVRRVVAISSMDVYRAWGVVHNVEHGPLEPMPITEDSPLRTTRQLYSPETLKMMASMFSWLGDEYDKIAVEEAIMGDVELPGTVLRLPMIYGPGDPLHRFFGLITTVTRMTLITTVTRMTLSGVRNWTETELFYPEQSGRALCGKTLLPCRIGS